MKKLILSISALMVIVITSAFGPLSPVVYSVDTSISKVFWTGKKVTGEHSGEVMIKNGEVFVSNGEPTGAKVIIDLSTITNSDIKDPEYNKKLVGHLKSEDFFHVEKHPEATIEVTKLEPLKKSGNSGENYMAFANLTIRGITNEITFPAKIVVNKNLLMIKGDVTFDRTRWDIKYGSGSFFKGLGDKTIYDDVKITFVLKAENEKS